MKTSSKKAWPHQMIRSEILHLLILIIWWHRFIFTRQIKIFVIKDVDPWTSDLESDFSIIRSSYVCQVSQVFRNVSLKLIIWAYLIHWHSFLFQHPVIFPFPFSFISWQRVSQSPSWVRSQLANWHAKRNEEMRHVITPVAKKSD